MPSTPIITVWQPWATLIAIGAKRFEFRGWPAPQKLWGQRIGIHAGARPVRPAEIRDLLFMLGSGEAPVTGIAPDIAVPLLERVLQAPRSLPLSSILGTATLGQPLRNADLATALGTPVVNDSDRTEHTNWGWPLADFRHLEPIVPARGAQGWWYHNLESDHG
jgi:hypothetical protein